MADTTLPESHVRRQIFVVAAAAAGLFVSYPAAIATSYIAFLDPLAAEFGGSRTIPSLGFGAATLGQAIGALLIGPILRHKPASTILLIAIPLLSLLVASLAAMPTIPLLFLMLNLAIGVASGGAGVGLYLSLLNLWFDARLGRAVGFALLGLSSGMLVLPVGAQLLIEVIGWRETYGVLAAISLAVGLATTWLLIRQGSPPLLNCAVQEGNGVRAAMAMRSVRFWAIAAGSLLAAMAGFGVAIHGVSIYRDLGATGSALVAVTAMLGIGSITGRFGLGLLIDWLHAPYVTALAFSVAGFACFYLASSGTSPWALFFVGLALGAEGDVIVFFTRRYFGNIDHATIYNRLLAMTYLGGMAGPPLIAASLENLHSYHAALAMAGGAFVLAATLVVGLGTYTYPAKPAI